MSGKGEREYVLGTGNDELERLGLQHRLWADAAHALWKAAGIGVGSRVLDVGCGPGYASFDLAQLVTSAGRVVGVDESANFIDFLNQQAGARHLAHLRGEVGDVHALEAATRERGFDAAYARWVLCFVKDPARVIAGIAALLRPGGRLAVNDYFNYTSMTMAPRRASHDKAVAATAKSWRERGGDPDIVGRLPALCESAGLTVTHIAVHQRIARGRSPATGALDPMFAWPDTWWRIYAPKLVQMGHLRQADCDELLRDLDEVRESTRDFIVVPPVYELIAVKKPR